MKRVLTSISTTIAALVLLLGFKTHSPASTTTHPLSQPISGNSQPDESTTSSTPTTTQPSRSSGARSITTTTNAPTKSATYDGDQADTRWGPVQVEIIVSGGKVTKISALEYPTTNNRDVSINTRAIPELINQALSAQSANIDGVSGASYTTEGFITSLQSALTKANLN